MAAPKATLTMNSLSGLIPLPEAARRCNLSDRSLRRRIADGTIDAVRVGPRLLMLDPAELDKLLSPVGGGAK